MTVTARELVDELWSVEDVAAFLRVPVETLYRWRKVKYGPPAARIGRHLRYDPTEVRAWVRSRAA
ncbi:helix-turn-helix transcriptional regulator [Micromonospora purpureochromogenes]|uniref:helix-turn-helix transcriptional regulator n=1 Tax=Micromonospora purpureochromogenes TaxID=47872 RepID=UPI003F4D4CF1